ncbi:MAG: hypothetical protein ABJA79_05565, partial [Parafilimonas sp.]
TRMRRIGLLFALSCLWNCTWILCWHYNFLLINRSCGTKPNELVGLMCVLQRGRSCPKWSFTLLQNCLCTKLLEIFRNDVHIDAIIRNDERIAIPKQVRNRLHEDASRLWLDRYEKFKPVP